MASPADFGAGVGQSAQQLGTAMRTAGARVAAYQEREDRLTAASLSARMAADWEVEYQNLVRGAPAGAPEFTGTVSDAYDRFAERYTGELSNRQHAIARPSLERARAQAVVRAARHQASSSATHNRQMAERGLAATINTVASNPAAFGTAVETGDELIGSLNLPANVRGELRTNHLNLLTKAAFEARIYAAKTPEELDAVLTDLATPEWQERASPATYDHLLDAARTYRRTLAHGRDSVARAAVEHLNERMTATGANRVEVEPTEIARVDQVVRNSGDPGVQWQWAQLKARYEAGRGALRASPDAVAAAAGSTEARIGLPADAHGAIDDASRSTGGRVTTSYLSQLARTQSGEHLDARRRGGRDYALQPVHARVDTGALRPEVREAGERAGEYFGQPLRVTSAHRSPHYNRMVGGARSSRHIGGSALDIDTTGMSPAEKGRLVDALVRAGFTGFGQYGTHIHADMRSSVPSGYGSRPGWGGWTDLDPQVAAVLERRGFRAGRPATEIDRSGADPEAGPALPERGLFGFDDETWTALVGRHGEALGLPVSDMTTRADMMRWRQNPRIAAQMAALYATENRTELREGLGREVSDAELGMAHAIGPERALVLLRAYRDAPSTPARGVLTNIERPDLLAAVDGRPPTVADVYGKLVGSFTAGTSALQHVRLEEVRRVQAEMDTARGDDGDIMTFAGRAGRVALAPLDSADAFAARGAQAAEVQQFYRLDSPRPLTADEVDRFTNVIRTGTVADVQMLLADLQRLGPQAATGAFRQLGSQNGVFAHVAGMTTSDPASAVVAHDVLRGAVRMREDPGIKDVLSNAPGGTDNQFNMIVGPALDAADPRVRHAVRQAADALYVQRHGSESTTFDPQLYEEAVSAVLNTQLDSVNGSRMVLPKGVTASDFDWALDALTPRDLAGLSVDGQPPRTRGGDAVSPIDIAYEGRFRAVGNDTYEVVMADGLPLWSGTGVKYRIRLPAETVQRLASQERASRTDEHGVPMMGVSP